MAEPLWTWAELLAAAGGVPEGEAKGGITGVSIDTRTLQPGDLFVALRGDNQDGHVYVTKAFEKGAAAALVSSDYVTPKGAGPLLRVRDATRDPVLVALEKLGVVARARLPDAARVIAVTGSVGKTSTKEMLRTCLTAVGRTHASEKSYNNHWGVPLTLARMPRDTQFGVFEIGMNHPEEIRPLTKMARPHVAIVTTVGAVHLGHFKSEEEIADAKAEIFDGLLPGGTAVLNADNPHFARLKSAATAARVGAHIRTFGTSHGGKPDFRILTFGPRSDGARTEFSLQIGDEFHRFEIGAVGAHQVHNAAAVIAAVDAIGVDPERCRVGLATFSAAAGRGARETLDYRGGRVVLIDESYNANPLSMSAALDAMFVSFRGQAVRQIAVLGDMRELGEFSTKLHRDMAEPVSHALTGPADRAFLCGPHMRALYDALPERLKGHYAETSEGLIAPLLATLAPGDVIMVKGSLGTRMAPIVEALRKTLAGTGTN